LLKTNNLKILVFKPFTYAKPVLMLTGIKTFFLILSLFNLPLFAQDKLGFVPDFSISQTTLVSSGNDLPFWMTSNINGVITLHNPGYLLFQAGFDRGTERDSLQKWGYTYGGNMVYGLGGGSGFHPNEYWFGARFRWLMFKAGAQADPVNNGGLSSTNGNMYRSRNARPVPGLSLSTTGYIPFFFAKKWFSFRCLYEEGILLDQQSVKNAHLHHKNLHLRGIISPSLSVTLGFDHYVFWGGYSDTYGQLPGWNEYFRYILGMKGGQEATLSDQINVAGNGLGNYSLELKKEWSSVTASLYWNHPFEDRSGMELANLRDGLWGIHLSKKKREAIITDFVYEYLYTLHQSGSEGIRGRDSYFNHGEYTSGFTYFQRMMGTPLFVPVIGTDGISKGFNSDRMWMHHLGLSGVISKCLSWKSLMTWSRNFGTFGNIYPAPLDEISFLTEFIYTTSKLPFALKAGAAGDYGDRFEKRYGGYLGIGIHF
jgi:hypothetical protein